MSTTTDVVDEVIDGRRGVYGQPTDTYPRIAQMWSAMLGHEVRAWEVPLLFMAAKMIRTEMAPDYSDNSDDIEGYLAIFRELIGPDMIHARSVGEYLAEQNRRKNTLVAHPFESGPDPAFCVLCGRSEPVHV